MKALKFKIAGRVPLLMCNGRMASPLDPHSKALKELTAVRKKTEETHHEIAHREFLGLLYTDEKGEPCIPAHVIEAVLVNGAKKLRLGKQFAAGTISAEMTWPLKYKGPRDPEKLWEAGNNGDTFFLQVTVRNQQARVLRTRPMFPEWSLEFTIHYDDTVVQKSQVEQAVEVAGAQVGIGDWRPRYGRFEVVGKPKAVAV